MKKALACALALLIVLIVILIALIVVPTGKRYCDFLAGMWVGDPAFLREAGLSDMQLFISPPEDGGRQGYLLMSDENGNLVANQAFDLVTRGAGWRRRLANHFCARDRDDIAAEISFDSDFDLLPSDLTWTLCIADGSLTLRNEEKLYGFLLKDMAASLAARTAWENRSDAADAEAAPPDSEAVDVTPLEPVESEEPDKGDELDGESGQPDGSGQPDE